MLKLRMNAVSARMVISALALMTLLAPTARAKDDIEQKQGIDRTAVRRAHAFLKTEKRGSYILSSFAHLGYKYHGHSVDKDARPVTREGHVVPGHFALVYTFEWGDGGETDVAFLCDAAGNVYEVKDLTSNGGVFNRPFFLAKASIQLVGNLVVELFGDQMTRENRQKLQRLVDDGDAKGVLEMSLREQQRLGV